MVSVFGVKRRPWVRISVTGADAGAMIAKMAWTKICESGCPRERERNCTAFRAARSSREMPGVLECSCHSGHLRHLSRR